MVTRVGALVGRSSGVPVLPVQRVRHNALLLFPEWLIHGMSTSLLSIFQDWSDVRVSAILEMECARRDAVTSRDGGADVRRLPCELEAVESDVLVDVPEVWTWDGLDVDDPALAVPEVLPEPVVSWGERREAWYLAAHADYLRAEDVCRGNLLSKAGLVAGVDPFTLWEGSAEVAFRYASRELRDFWSENGRRTPISMLGGARAAAGRIAEFHAGGAL